jgi:hypothetical protein
MSFNQGTLFALWGKACEHTPSKQWQIHLIEGLVLRPPHANPAADNGLQRMRDIGLAVPGRCRRAAAAPPSAPAPSSAAPTAASASAPAAAPLLLLQALPLRLLHSLCNRVNPLK